MTHLLLVFWLGTAPAGVSVGTYETFVSEDDCNTRLSEVLNSRVAVYIARKDNDLPLMRCIKI